MRNKNEGNDMCTYKEIGDILLSNGQTVNESNQAADREIERIYVESWNNGISVPFFDNEGNT